jgi:beta-mannosidase
MMQFFSLDGEWQMRWGSGTRGNLNLLNQREGLDSHKMIAARVPGEVHADLLRLGIIGDPNVGTNVLAARWVEEMRWGFRRLFAPPAGAMENGARVWLTFDQLDYAATIFLNGVEIGTHENTFYPARIDVTGKLTAGENLLVVILDSGLFSVADKEAGHMANSLDAKLHKRHWLRKTQSTFEWDWSPRLINVGITGSVRLEIAETALRPDQFVPLTELSADLQTGSVRGRWFVENTSSAPIAGTLRLELDGKVITQAVEFRPGVHPVEATITVETPTLWWPIGHGAAHRYPIHATLLVGDETIATTSAMVGFRHVRINQDVKAGGTSSWRSTGGKFSARVATWCRRI